MGEKETSKCSECQDYTEHTFYQCHELNVFLTHVEQFIFTETDTHINIKEMVALFGFSCKELYTKDKTDKINLILLKARLSILKFKYCQIKNVEIIFDLKSRLRSMR